MKTYSNTSRTLDPTNKSLTTVVGRHDQKLSDADVNLIQDLQDYKRDLLLQNTIFSGGLNYQPFRFDINLPNTFSCSAFDVMFNGEVVQIGGNNSTNLSFNTIILPAPTASTAPSPSANLYIVYLELWYQTLDPTTGAGYAVQNNVNYIYPNGCTTVNPSLWLSDDVVDTFNNLTTTTRSQVQWAIRCAPISLAYDFTALNYGLDPGLTSDQQIVGLGPSFTPPSGASYFSNMGSQNGDYGLWRATGLGTATEDGCSYAMPIAVVFRRTLDVFNQAVTPFGAAMASTPYSGLISPPIGYTPQSGRYDKKFADSVYDSDVVDTRMTVSLKGYDGEKLLNQGFVDLVNGNLQLKIGRGDSLGNIATALGSRVGYTISVGGTATANINNVGTFNGFINGFGLDNRAYYTAKTITTSDKVSPNLVTNTDTNGSDWQLGDTFVLTLPSSYTFSFVMIQGLAAQTVGNPIPILLNGMFSISGMGTSALTATCINVPAFGFQPGGNPLQIYVGVVTTTPSISTVKVPYSMDYGVLVDAEGAVPTANIPVFAISDFLPIKTLGNYTIYNPNYSNKIFGTTFSYSTLTTSPTTSFTILNSSLPYNGAYVTSVTDSTGATYSISSQSVTNSGITLTLSQSIIAGTTLSFSVLLLNVAQMGYTAPIKGITSIKETVLFGNAPGSLAALDPRVLLVSTNVASGVTTYIFSVTDCLLSGIGGNYIFTQPVALGPFVPVPVSSVVYSNGFVYVNVPTTSTTTNFFLIGNLSPAFTAASSLVATFDYIPYQGDGNSSTNYSVSFSEDFALVTTNGTGSAPVIGLQDVFPYNRELPLTVSLPAQSSWNDTQLKNQEMASTFDNNYATKQYNNIDHTFKVPLKTNDFIEPVGGWKTKLIQFENPGIQGFGNAYPQIGFALTAPQARVSIGQTTFATVSPIDVYVNNVTGDDSQDGLSIITPKQSIQSALAVLPATLNHPCCVFLVYTGTPYTLVSSQLVTANLGDGNINPVSYYSIENLTFTIQEAGMLYIGREAGVPQYVQIDASNYYLDPLAGGSTSAFTVFNSGVTFGGINFTGFGDQAIYATGSNVNFSDCTWSSNTLCGSFEKGCNVTIYDGSVTLTSGSAGFSSSGSSITVSGLIFNVADPTVLDSSRNFFVCDRNSSLSLSNHTTTSQYESGIQASSIVVVASMNSSVDCAPAFTSNGAIALATYSIATSATNLVTGAFAGGLIQPSVSSVITDSTGQWVTSLSSF